MICYGGQAIIVHIYIVQDSMQLQGAPVPYFSNHESVDLVVRGHNSTMS